VKNNIGKSPRQEDPFTMYGREVAAEKYGSDFEPWDNDNNVVQLRPTLSLADLAAERRWVAWCEETHKGELKKIPKNPATGGNAQVPTNPSTYGTRAAAEQRWEKIKKQTAIGGIGIVLGELTDDRYLAGIDLDSCRSKDGMIADWAQAVIDRFNTCGEISPSGGGIKVVLPADCGRHAKAASAAWPHQRR